MLLCWLEVRRDQRGWPFPPHLPLISLPWLTLDSLQEMSSLSQRPQGWKDPMLCPLNPTAASIIISCFLTETVLFPSKVSFPGLLKLPREKRKANDICIGKWGKRARECVCRQAPGCGLCGQVRVWQRPRGGRQWQHCMSSSLNSSSLPHWAFCLCERSLLINQVLSTSMSEDFCQKIKYCSS